MIVIEGVSKCLCLWTHCLLPTIALADTLDVNSLMMSSFIGVHKRSIGTISRSSSEEEKLKLRMHDDGLKENIFGIRNTVEHYH